MKKRFLCVVLLALAFALPAIAGGGPQRDLLYLQNGSGLRISIETYRAKEGWTPVIVSVAGAEMTAVMDEKGRVIDARTKDLGKHSVPLFTIELEKGRILLGREAHPIRIIEQNDVRTRLGLAEGAILMPLRLDDRGTGGTLRFGGLDIPATMNGPDPTRLAGSRTSRQTPGVGQVAPPKGPRTSAQLVPSRIRARGK